MFVSPPAKHGKPPSRVARPVLLLPSLLSPYATHALVFLFTYLFAGPAFSLPIVSFDVDPMTPGIQSQFEVSLETPFTVDVLISAVDIETPINGFSFDLDYEGLVLTALSIQAGGFLTGTPIALPESLEAPTLSFALGSLGPGDTGDGILARIEFIAHQSGTSMFNLHSVLLGQPFPAVDALATERVDNAQITAVPEPSSIAMLALGLTLLAGRRVQTS